jgi:hypothetical protein
MAIMEVKELEAEIKKILSDAKVCDDKTYSEALKIIKKLEKLNPNKLGKYEIWRETIINFQKDIKKLKKS